MDYAPYLKQIDEVLGLIPEFERRRNSTMTRFDGETHALERTIYTRLISTIIRITGPNSFYAQQADEISKQETGTYLPINDLSGLALALKAEIEAGYLKTLSETIHADVFSDYLEMAEHLLETGYKDAAAVIAGSTLESHLRKMADLSGVDIQAPNGKNKTMSPLSQDLVKAGAYNKVQAKSVESWAGIRNSAAHGNYGEYDDKIVILMLMGIQDFIAKYPA